MLTWVYYSPIYAAIMTVPRSLVINDDVPAAYHLISRCVRRAFLCGAAAAHRQEWLRKLVSDCAASFAIDVFSYAFMQNHFHLTVWTAPRRVESWSAHEVARRWALSHPRTARDGTPREWSEAEILKKSDDSEWIATARDRLKSISWFMKTIKETIARRANREDKCTGHFSTTSLIAQKSNLRMGLNNHLHLRLFLY